MINQDIFGLDISMSNSWVMEVLNSQYKLAENYSGQFLTKQLWILDQAMQLPITGELHHVV